MCLPFHIEGMLPKTFGHAIAFNPLPNNPDLVIGAHCPWEVRLNVAENGENRVPPIITEIICQSPSEHCGGNTNYRVIFFSTCFFAL